MAVLKHLKIKNSNYTASMEYLLYQHVGDSGTILRDENGEPIFREKYLIEGINTTPESYAYDCRVTNRLYDKNKDKNEIKAHHYIISFDPKDRELGLTMEKAQEIGMEFARKHFYGHEVIVCTHDDGNNESGNIHCHIVFNSVRKIEMERKDFMKKEAEYKIGCKHQVSNEMLGYLKKDLMEICEREKLNQVDLLSPAKIRVSDREYRHVKKFRLINHMYQSVKNFIRNAIYAVLHESKTIDEFEDKLKNEEGIDFRYSKDDIIYHSKELNMSFKGEKLGSMFSLRSIESLLGPRKKIERMVDVSENKKAIKNPAYRNRVELNNVQKTVDTMAFLREAKFRGIDDIDLIISTGEQYSQEIYEEYSKAKERLAEVNLRIRMTGQYYSTKDIYSEYLSSGDKKTFREQHTEELASHEEARKELQRLSPGGKFTGMKELKEMKEKIKATKNELYDELVYTNTMLSNLKNVRENMRIMSKPKRLISHDMER
ncbi:MAG: relaxase/mobilization nuclease domain-containing protein [Clostridia bacterium]|nr:relaxase/mobilization nuclease domain-containing protein [Clostridia bacterium]